MDEQQFFKTRGVVLTVEDLRSLDWPERIERAGLNTLGTHVFPHQVAAFSETDEGQALFEACRARGIEVEHELHAMSDLLPRDLFEKDPAMFPMNDEGNRMRDYNLCVHSRDAVEIACENAAEYTRRLPSTTGRYFYWLDDGRPMCRCPLCRELSDSDQALLLENEMLAALRQIDHRATLAHLAYENTLRPPTQVRPRPGIFLEFAPIRRRYDLPLKDGIPEQREWLDRLDENLEVFGREGAQALEYWLDVSRFAGWDRANLRALPWNGEVFHEDLKTYAGRGIRHVTTFAVWVDGEYVERFGEPPLEAYGARLL